MGTGRGGSVFAADVETSAPPSIWPRRALASARRGRMTAVVSLRDRGTVRRRTAAGSAARSSFCGAQGYASKKRSRSLKPIWIVAAARCSSVAARATPPRGGYGRVGLEELQPWLERRLELPVGPLFPRRPWPHPRPSVVERGRPRGPAPDRRAAGVRRRVAPHQLRHAHAVELAREGVPLIVIQRQLGHSNLGITSLYPGNRHRRDHRDSPRAPCANDPRRASLRL
jgi:hypothetical protein